MISHILIRWARGDSRQPSAVEPRTDFSAAEFRPLTKRSKDNNQSRHGFKDVRPGRLRNRWAGGGPAPRPSAEQKAELAAIVDAGRHRALAARRSSTRHQGPLPARLL
jgi:hypothetical protein